MPDDPRGSRGTVVALHGEVQEVAAVPKPPVGRRRDLSAAEQGIYADLLGDPG